MRARTVNLDVFEAELVDSIEVLPECNPFHRNNSSVEDAIGGSPLVPNRFQSCDNFNQIRSRGISVR